VITTPARCRKSKNPRGDTVEQGSKRERFIRLRSKQSSGRHETVKPPLPRSTPRP
jgi:hypothetical protein